MLDLTSAQVLADGLDNLLQRVLGVVHSQDEPYLWPPISYVHHHTAEGWQKNTYRMSYPGRFLRRKSLGTRLVIPLLLGHQGTLLGQGCEWWGPCFDRHQTLGEMECHHARQTGGEEETGGVRRRRER